MTIGSQEILSKALSLQPMARAKLISALIESFDKEGREHLDSLWAEEAESRIEAFDAGKLTADSAAAVFDRLNNP